MFYPKEFKRIRLDQKITQQQIANALGMGRLSITRWENDQTKPSDCDIRTAAQYLNISVSEISDLEDFKQIGSNNSITIAEICSAMEKKTDIPENIKVKFNELKHLLTTANNNLTVCRREKSDYDFIIQNLPFIIYIKNAANLKYKYVNDAFLTLLPQNESLKTVYGSTSSSFFGLNEYKNILELEKRVIRQRHRVKEILPIPGTNGRKVGEFNIIPVIENNKVNEISCTIKEVTYEYEEEKSRKELERAVNGLCDLIWIGHKQNPKNIVEPIQYTFVSNSCFNYWGISKESLLNGKISLFDLIHPDDAEQVEEWYSDTTYPKKKEFRIFINNEIRYVSMQAFNDGNTFWGIMTDISLIRQNEINRYALEFAVNHLNDLIWIGYRDNPDNLNEPIEYSYISDSCERDWGIPKKPLLEGETTLFKYIHPDDQDMIQKWYSKTDSKGKKKCRAIINENLKYISLQIFKKGRVTWGIASDITNSS